MSFDEVFRMFQQSLVSVQSMAKAAAQEIMESPTEKDIVALLSRLDLGLRPDDEQFAAAQAAMDGLKTSGVLKVFSIKIVTPKGGARSISVGWSRLLDFPSQTFTVPVSSLTAQNQEVREVMED